MAAPQPVVRSSHGWVRWNPLVRGIEWYKARPGGISIAVSRLQRRIAHQVGVRQGRGSPHWNPLAEMN